MTDGETVCDCVREFVSDAEDDPDTLDVELAEGVALRVVVIVNVSLWEWLYEPT